MFKVSTYFIKTQIPGVTKTDLVNRYKQELEIQSADNISVKSDTISFGNNTFRLVLNKFANKFSNFSTGQIKIVDEVDEFGVYFEANLARLLSSAAVIAGIAMLVSFFSIGFNILPLIVGFVIFLLMTTIGFVSAKIAFPVYFTNLRNDIEREFSNR